ncbi:MAG: glycosyltransferase N-terminal domain-containing protein [Tateyamaria sp.]|uniref:3-deoxy-D-manno-octulosonic acid transferase n=1 Tax=Tateyamaria sp. TaxID=1929288 RepID=UPI00329F1686
MRGSIGLAAYRSLSARRTAPDYTPKRDRPTGEVVWLHAAQDGNNRALLDLALRLVQMRHGTHVVLTAAQGDFDTGGSAFLHVEDIVGDHPNLAKAFVQHWKPDVVIWAWGGLRPNLILAAADSGAYMILIDAAHNGFDGRRDRWLPEVPKRLIARFDHVIAQDADAHLRVAQLGRPLSRIELSPPLHPFGQMLPAADTDIDDVMLALSGRPSWLAARTSRDEGRIVLGAHRLAVRTSHRLLLILHATSVADGAHLLDLAQAAGLRAANWGIGQLPDDNCQVLIADADDELGLWLRIAPVTFLGGSLHPDHAVCDPYTAAAHGTAIIYGPHVGDKADDFTRLTNAHAARIVNDKQTLGRAVTQMIAPDQAAQMAMAGWDIVTQGAHSLDRIIDLVQIQLDTRDRGKT